MTIIFLPIYSVSGSIDYGSNGVDWNELCLYVQPALYKSCNEYVYNNGDLTSEGEKAYHCIRNGALIGGAALFIPGLGEYIVPGLAALAKMTDCDGIVNFDRFSLLNLPFIANLFD